MSAVSQLKWLLKKEREEQPPIFLTAEEEEQRATYEKSFYEFIKGAWHTIEPNPYQDNFHVQAVADHLQACYEGKIKTLIINIPPRTGKSTILTLFVPWIFTRDSSRSFLCLSGSNKISLRDNLRAKRIIEHDWYQNLWGEKVKLRADAKAKQRFETTAGGVRMAYSMLSSVRGEGGSVICDDPNTDIDAISEVTRSAKAEYWAFNVSLRTNNMNDFRVVVQQRLHQEDLTGYILSTEKDVVHLKIPMRLDLETRCRTYLR